MVDAGARPVSGEFFDPTVPREHQCGVPPPQPSGGWRCDCGKAYIVENLGPRDINPGELPYQWRRAPAFDASRLASTIPRR